MTVMDILFCIIISGLLTWICYCIYSYSRYEDVTIYYLLDRELIVGDVCYDVTLEREVLYCGDDLYTDNNIYAVVVYTEENVIHIAHSLKDCLLILDKQE